MEVIIYIFILNWVIGIVYVISFIFIYIVNSKGIQRFIGKKKIYLNELESSTTIFGEMVKGIKDIKVLNLKAAFMKKSENAFLCVNHADTDFQVESAKYYSFSDLM